MSDLTSEEGRLTTIPISTVLTEIVPSEKQKIIILGEKHFYNPEAFSNIKKIIEDAIRKFGAKHVAIYLEAPNEALGILAKKPEFTGNHVLELAHKNGLAVLGSNITLKNRNRNGSSDAQYAADIMSIFSKFKTYPKHCVIACVGLLHSIEIFNRIPETFDRHVYNVCGSETAELMAEILFGVLEGKVTRENYLSLRRLPIVMNDTSGGSLKSKSRKRIHKKRTITRKT